MPSEAIYAEDSEARFYACYVKQDLLTLLRDGWISDFGNIHVERIDGTKAFKVSYTFTPAKVEY